MAGVADCIDYGVYMHRVGFVGFAAMARSVAAEESFFVAGSSFTVVDTSNPELPEIVAAIQLESVTENPGDREGEVSPDHAPVVATFPV
jgi:hypothetical protein